MSSKFYSDGGANLRVNIGGVDSNVYIDKGELARTAVEDFTIGTGTGDLHIVPGTSGTTTGDSVIITPTGTGMVKHENGIWTLPDGTTVTPDPAYTPPASTPVTPPGWPPAPPYTPCPGDFTMSCPKSIEQLKQILLNAIADSGYREVARVIFKELGKGRMKRFIVAMSEALSESDQEEQESGLRKRIAEKLKKMGRNV